MSKEVVGLARGVVLEEIMGQRTLLPGLVAPSS